MTSFTSVSRQRFRQVFQPSRILLALFNQPNKAPNVITLAFDMYCSYKPNMMAFSVHKKSYTHELQANAMDCVLSVPGESLADFALFSGTTSGRDLDKIAQAGIGLVPSVHVKTPGLAAAIANIELEITARVPTGDHTTIFGVVRAFNVNPTSTEQSLLSVGPKHGGYRVLARKGIHRIGIATSSNAEVQLTPPDKAQSAASQVAHPK